MKEDHVGSSINLLSNNSWHNEANCKKETETRKHKWLYESQMREIYDQQRWGKEKREETEKGEAYQDEIEERLLISFYKITIKSLDIIIRGA